MAGEDQTEAATPRRLQRAREEGSVAISREVPALAGLGAATLMLSVTGAGLGQSALARLGPMLSVHGGSDVAAALAGAALAAAALAAPIVLGVLAAAVAASLLQTGFLFNPAALSPDLARLNPARGLKRIFGVTGLVETAKSVVKLGVLGFAIYHVIAAAVPLLAKAVFWFPEQLASQTTRLALQLALTLLGAQTVIAGDRYYLGPPPARQAAPDEQGGNQAGDEGGGRQPADQAASAANPHEPCPEKDACSGPEGNCGSDEPHSLRYRSCVRSY